MAVQKGDFIKLSYTGKLQNGVVFDTTDANVAKEHGIYNEKASYGPETIVVGKGYVVPGLDEEIIGKDVGYKGSVNLPPEKGFGMKRLDMIETIPSKKFKEKVKPGMRVQVNNRTGMVESTEGGRARINFNPLFAGETLDYDFTVEELIEGNDNKIAAIAKMYAGRDLTYEIEGEKVLIEVPQDLRVQPALVHHEERHGIPDQRARRHQRSHLPGNLQEGRGARGGRVCRGKAR